MVKKIIYKDITFINFNLKKINILFKKKGLFVFPAGPTLANMETHSKYHQSLKQADYVFLDSGYFVLLLKLFKSLKVNKFSGFKFLEYFSKYLSKNKDKIIFSIDPDLNQSEFNRKYFDKIGVKKVFSYIAPIYKKSNIVDKKLINQIKKVKPNYILTNNTNNFLESGIVKFSIPKEATTENTKLPSGYFWLKITNKNR